MPTAECRYRLDVDGGPSFPLKALNLDPGKLLPPPELAGWCASITDLAAFVADSPTPGVVFTYLEN